MNPKIVGIILLIVGLGVGLYFINSGGASKFGSLFTPPGSSSTISAVATSSPTQPTGAAQTPSSTSGFSWNSFFQSLFSPPHGFANIPSVGSGGGSGNPGYVSGLGSSDSGSGSGSESGASSVTPPPGFTVNQLSPYYQKVRFSGVSTGEIGITTYPAYGTPTSTVDVTGWEIKTNHGGEFIPQVSNIYYPSGVSPVSDVILSLNQINYVNLYSNSAPANIRVNACMGYLNTPQQFNPGFSYDCPAVDRSQISQFTGACQNYIVSLNNCQSPDFSSSYFPRNDYQCEDYLQGKYTYNWCVSTYATMPNFLSNEWRIWMGATPLDPYHDTVELLDTNGLLVAVYSY
jgi:hypothetical protein